MSDLSLTHAGRYFDFVEYTETLSYEEETRAKESELLEYFNFDHVQNVGYLISVKQHKDSTPADQPIILSPDWVKTLKRKGYKVSTTGDFAALIRPFQRTRLQVIEDCLSASLPF